MAERSAALDSVRDDEIAKAAEKEPKGTEAIIIAERSSIMADLEASIGFRAQEEGCANDCSFEDEYLQKNNGLEEDNLSVVLAGFNGFKNNLSPVDPKDTTSELKNTPSSQKDGGDVGHRWQRLDADKVTSPPAQTNVPSSERPRNDTSIKPVVRKRREEQSPSNASRLGEEMEVDIDEGIDHRDRRSANDKEIRQIQKDIDCHSKAYSQHANRDTEFNNFKGRLQQCADRFSKAVFDVRRNQPDMTQLRLAIFQLRDAKAYPTPTPAILGSLEEKTRQVRTEEEDVEQLMESVESEFEDRLQKLKASLAQASGISSISTSGSEGRIREDDIIVEDEAEDFVPDSQRSSRRSERYDISLEKSLLIPPNKRKTTEGEDGENIVRVWGKKCEKSPCLVCDKPVSKSNMTIDLIINSPVTSYLTDRGGLGLFRLRGTSQMLPDKVKTRQNQKQKAPLTE